MDARLVDPNPQPNIADDPNVLNLRLTYTGDQTIAGPMDLGSFVLEGPEDVAGLQYYAQAFDSQGNPVLNFGVVPEPTSAALLVSGLVAFVCGARRGWRR
jgi:hypothetical protein